MKHSLGIERQFLSQFASHRWDQDTLSTRVSAALAQADDTREQTAIGELTQYHNAQLWPWALMLGMVMGLLTMLGLLSYSGEQPINLLWLLLLFVALPLVLLMVSWALLVVGVSLPSPWQRLPKLKSLQAQALLPPARFYLQWLNQWLGLGYSLGGLLLFIVLVVGQDLAFGWASTLQITAPELQHLTQVLSAPWNAWLSAAHPSQELIEQSQFYRWQENRDYIDPRLLSQWWPFVAMMIVTYGLLPRVVSLLVSHLCLKRSVSAHWPRTPALSEWRAQVLASQQARSEHARHVVNVSELKPPHIGWRLSSQDHPLIAHTLGLGSLDDDDALMQSIGPQGRHVTVWVKAYESPQAELTDLLSACHQQSMTLVVFSQQTITDAQYISWERFCEHSALPLQIAELAHD